MSVQKEDLRKKSVECVKNNATKTRVNNNPILGFVDCLKTNVDWEVVSNDTLHQKNLVFKLMVVCVV